MTTFLHRTAELIWQASNGQPDSHTVILPGRRAGLYLKRELAVIAGTPIWAPRMLTLSEFLQQSTGLRAANTSELIFVAYEAYRHCGGDASFEDFLSWIHTALSDFSSVDHYLVDARKFFSNLRDIRDIEHWSLNEETLSKDQRHLVVFWEKLGQLYSALRQKLTDQGMMYPAMLTRHAAENPQWVEAAAEWGQLWLVGFNALSPAEQKVAELLVRQHGMRVLWDADAYYLDDEMNEAGFHLRAQMKRLPNLLSPSTDLIDSEKEICLHPLSGEASQAKAMARLLQNTDGVNTAVVLCNNNFLAPVLESIPPNIKEFNVSAGISLAATPLYELIKAAFSLFSKNPPPDQPREIYHRHLLRFLQLPLVGRPAEALDPGVVGRFKTQLIRNHRITVRWTDDSKGEGLEALRALDGVMAATEISGGAGVIALFTALTDLLVSGVPLTEVEAEYVFQLARLTRQVKGLVEKYPFADTPEALKTVFMTLLRAEQITFYGEPLTGLQVIGLLETRNLDFDHVILLGANEDVLPASRAEQSLIPHDLKTVFGMPGYKHRDALFAYYFYRLIQRAKRVDILYSTSAEGTRTAEVSRFVRQLQLESPTRNPLIRFTSGHNGTAVAGREPLLAIRSTPAIRASISEQLTKGFSPSALNKFLTCPRDYYYRYVLGLGEPDEMEETPESSTFGIIVHDSLEELYALFVNIGPLDVDRLQLLKEQVSESVKRHFTDYYPEKHMYQGQNLLTFRACEHYVRNLISCDIQRLREGETITISGLETEISHRLTLLPGHDVLFSGKADRIEHNRGLPMIVDYKTGGGSEKDLKLKSINELDKKPKAFQLMLYAWIWHRSHPGTAMRAGIIFLRSFRSGVVPLIIDKSDILTDAHFDEFEKWLRQKANQLLDPELVFDHNTKSKYCLYCGG